MPAVLADGSGSGSFWTVPTDLRLLIPTSQDILWALVCFVVGLLVVRYYVIPRYSKLLAARLEATEGNDEGAKNVLEEARRVRAEHEAIISGAREEARQIRLQAHADGAAIIDDVRQRATHQAELLTTEAMADIRRERDVALLTLRSQVGQLGTNLASSVVGAHVSDDVSKAVVEEFLSSIEETQ